MRPTMRRSRRAGSWGRLHSSSWPAYYAPCAVRRTISPHVPARGAASHRGSVHVVTVAEIEGVLVDRAVIMLDFPVIAVEIGQVERIDAVPVGRLGDLADLVFVLHRDCRFVGVLDGFAAIDFEPPVIEHAHRLDVLSDPDADDAELNAAARMHGLLGMAHAFQAEEFLIELARFLQAAALERAVRQDEGLDHRILVVRAKNGFEQVHRRLLRQAWAGSPAMLVAVAPARSASVRKASA